MNKLLALIPLVFFLHCTTQPIQHRNIAITIDDVPNTAQFQRDGFKHVLLNKLDSLNIPVAIFVNESLVEKNDSVQRNLELLEAWCKHRNVTLGNHTYSHPWYSETPFEKFVEDIEKGEQHMRTFAATYNKKLRYFRFPFNDLGNDSLQQTKIDSVLKSKGYTSTPFTSESSDWMFSAVYDHYLQNNEHEKVRALGHEYVEKTLAVIAYMDSLSVTEYKRSINQIYLCHDNALNAAYLPEIINRLKQKHYNIISLEEALTDSAYAQPNGYYHKWGVSWVYRWMTSQEQRTAWMKREPDFSELQKLYNELPVK